MTLNVKVNTGYFLKSETVALSALTRLVVLRVFS